MSKKYFPGANSGKGFFSRFGGIVPPWEKKHYTYVLKGGPGVGKNTLMRKVLLQAEKKGYTVEEFHCASDPQSLDAVRIEELCVVLLDGTAPHSIDPILPGIYDEILDLGHFKNQKEFATHESELTELFKDNKRHYRAAYAMLGAASALKKEAMASLAERVNYEKVRKMLQPILKTAENGEWRELFARSATPDGVVDYSKTVLPQNTMFFSGIIGEAILYEAEKLLGSKRCEVLYDFVAPEYPRAVLFDGGAVAVTDGGEVPNVICKGEIPAYVRFLLAECERLVERAVNELSKSLFTHDRIEEIYRDFVDYDRVSSEGEALIEKIFKV